MQFSDKVYSCLKWLCLVVIPAIAVFYTVLDETFGWGCSEQVNVVCAALCTLIGSLIGISTATYNKQNSKK